MMKYILILQNLCYKVPFQIISFFGASIDNSEHISNNLFTTNKLYPLIAKSNAVDMFRKLE